MKAVATEPDPQRNFHLRTVKGQTRLPRDEFYQPLKSYTFFFALYKASGMKGLKGFLT